MKKLVPAAAFIAVLALSASVLQHRSVKQLCSGFLPENDMKIPVGDVRARGIDEAMFNSVLDRVERVYTPIVAAKGGQLRVVRKWTDPTVNAYAQQMGNVWQITMFGGLARHAATTEEGFMLVACHELGHHIGGHPKSSWATNEGGSDYYATLKCMRIMYGENAPLGEVDPVAEAGCSAQFPQGARNGCRNGARGGQSVAFLFQALRNSPTPPKFDTPNTTVVDRMYNQHPETQCRLDTYYQGALCTAALGTDVGSDPNAGTCTAKNGQSVGLRPRCWYKPSPTESASPADGAVAGRTLGLDEKSISAKLESMRAVLSGRGI